MEHEPLQHENPTKQIRAILFDFDGTLINSVDILMAFLLRWGGLYGGTVTRDDFLKVNGMSIVEALQTLVRQGKIKRRALLRMLFEYPSLKKELREQTQLYPHAQECIHLWQNQLPLAIVTSGPRKHVHHFLQHFDLLQHFACIVSRNDVKNKKPEPEPFLKASKALGIEPSSCLVLEDSPNGAQAGLRAGMVVGVVLHTTPKESFLGNAAPHFFLNDLSELHPTHLRSQGLTL
ncbi:MAG: HAD family phosphatase [Deltaproteobacteria bacterium]|nr:MAG: HAD family phosphatase [Deltaproteobacteria bacterium]